MSSMAQTEGSAVKVVGFQVNGRTAENEGEVATASGQNLTGSPLPVSIPPPFKTPRGQSLGQHAEALKTRTETTGDGVLDLDLTQTSSELTRRIHPMAEKEPTTPLLMETPKSPMKELAAPTKTSSGGSHAKKGSSEKKAHGGKAKKEKTTETQKQSATKTAPCVSLFDHLEPFKPFVREAMLRRDEVASLDPVFVQFCVDYAENKLNESKACKEMLDAFCHAVDAFRNNTALFDTRDYLAYLSHYIGFLTSCRALNIAMRNSIRIIKVEVSKLKSGIPLEEGKDAVRRVLQGFIEERVDVAHIIAKEADALIKDEDVILTYSSSDTVLAVLSYAWSQQKKRFRVIVVDARPDIDGKDFLRHLSELGIPCTYLLMNALGFALKDVSKILMGASAVMSNGAVFGRAGSAAVALMAQASNVPTILCCQTLKFLERVQLDSFTHNELGDTKELTVDRSHTTEEHPFLSLLNLKYDLMPSTFVSIIVSELGFTPASSVSVILREQASEKEVPHI